MIKVNNVIVENFYEMIDEFNQIKDHLSLGKRKGSEFVRIEGDFRSAVSIYIIVSDEYDLCEDKKGKLFEKKYVLTEISWGSLVVAKSDFASFKAKHIIDACDKYKEITDKYRDVVVWKSHTLDEAQLRQIDKDNITSINLNKLNINKAAAYSLDAPALTKKI